jgi:hypothetical protein
VWQHLDVRRIPIAPSRYWTAMSEQNYTLDEWEHVRNIALIMRVHVCKVTWSKFRIEPLHHLAKAPPSTTYLTDRALLRKLITSKSYYLVETQCHAQYRVPSGCPIDAGCFSVLLMMYQACITPGIHPRTQSSMLMRRSALHPRRIATGRKGSHIARK